MSFGQRTATIAEPDAPPDGTAALVRATPAQFADTRRLALAELDPVLVAEMDGPALKRAIADAVGSVASERRIQLNAREQAALADELVHDMLGLGPLEPLLADERVTDIMVNGPKRTFIERSGRLELSDVTFRDNQHLMAIAQRIASAMGRRIDESSPLLDARLADGSRVNIVIPPLALDGPCLSIRKFAAKRIDMASRFTSKVARSPTARSRSSIARSETSDWRRPASARATAVAASSPRRSTRAPCCAGRAR